MYIHHLYCMTHTWMYSTAYKCTLQYIPHLFLTRPINLLFDYPSFYLSVITVCYFCSIYRTVGDILRAAVISTSLIKRMQLREGCLILLIQDGYFHEIDVNQGWPSCTCLAEILFFAHMYVDLGCHHFETLDCVVETISMWFPKAF